MPAEDSKASGIRCSTAAPSRMPAERLTIRGNHLDSAPYDNQAAARTETSPESTVAMRMDDRIRATAAKETDRGASIPRGSDWTWMRGVLAARRFEFERRIWPLARRTRPFARGASPFVRGLRVR